MNLYPDTVDVSRDVEEADGAAMEEVQNGSHPGLGMEGLNEEAHARGKG